jgi:hypothetical protein
MRQYLDFSEINERALSKLPCLLFRWLPTGKLDGQEFIALNPTRVDNRLGSFRINIQTGVWADFSTKDRGGDVISLAAYLFGISQYESAKLLATV